MRFITLFLALAATALFAGPPGGKFTLQVFQGYRFASGEVVKSGTDTADLNFTFQTRRIGMISYLGADKINFFEKAPAAGSIPPSQIDSWKDYVAGPSPGYYVIRTKGRKVYLLHLTAFENQGKAASYWRMQFEWQEFGQ